MSLRNRHHNNRHRRGPGPEATSLIGHLETDADLPVAALTELARRRRPLLEPAEAQGQAEAAVATVRGLGLIDRLLADDEIDEIMINGPGRVWVDRCGRLIEVANNLSSHDLDLIVERILSPLGLRVDRLRPIVDARLPDGSRINVVAPPLAVGGPLLSIRRFRREPIPATAFGPPDLVGLLSRLVADRASILVVGATSSGKTTLLNALAGLVDDSERLVTIEDTAELALPRSHVVSLEARPPNSEGVGMVSLRQLVTTALRLRPDRLIVGEVRGPEAFDLLLALTSGHRGSMSTCHALRAEAGLRRLQMLASLASADLSPDLLQSYVIDAIDVVVHVERRGRERRVATVARVGQPRLRQAVGPGFDLEVLWPVRS